MSGTTKGPGGPQRGTQGRGCLLGVGALALLVTLLCLGVLISSAVINITGGNR